MKQTTIKQVINFEGVGLHTGVHVNMSLHPAPASHGYKFCRTDIDNHPIINADASYVVSTNRGTTIQSENVSISTIEHILSALVGSEIDNVLIKLDGPEVPILDGTSLQFVEGIEKAGTETLDVDREYLHIDSPISYIDEETGSQLLALPSEHFTITTLIDFNSPVLGPQHAILHSLANYKKEIAPCRTFVFVHELEHLLNQGLIKGGDLDNAIVLANQPMADDELNELAAKLNKKAIKISSAGVLNTTALKFTNEPSRHKLLDVIGDLALVGRPLKANIIATKPGHTSNVAFAKLLKKHLQEIKKIGDKPKYNPDIEPILNTVEIQKKLPHRYPFLMVDKIIELNEKRVVGIKNVTFNEQLFQGHFPDNPIFPGVLQVEAMAQTGGILALANVPEGEKWDTYFLKIDNAKFKSKVLPGDTMMIKMELLEEIRRGIVHMKGTIWVGNKIVSEADMTAQIVKRS